MCFRPLSEGLFLWCAKAIRARNRGKQHFFILAQRQLTGRRRKILQNSSQGWPFAGIGGESRKSEQAGKQGGSGQAEKAGKQGSAEKARKAGQIVQRPPQNARPQNARLQNVRPAQDLRGADVKEKDLARESIIHGRLQLFRPNTASILRMASARISLFAAKEIRM